MQKRPVMIREVRLLRNAAVTQLFLVQVSVKRPLLLASSSQQLPVQL